ncbi:hypothetical protein [Paenibacillus sp. FSL K6-2524]
MGSTQVSTEEIVNAMQEQGRLAAEQLTEQQRSAFAAVLEQQMQEVKQNG